MTDWGMTEWGFPNRATPPGSSSYYSLRLAPARGRDALAAILAWRHSLRSIPEEVSDPGVARRKLDWWREELARARDDRPRHPLGLALAPIIAAHTLPCDPFDALADGVEAELLGHRPRDEADFARACDRDLGGTFELMARCAGVGDAEALRGARRLGEFCARVYAIRDSGALLRRGRAFLPEDRLRQAGLGHARRTDPGLRGSLPGLLAEAAARARETLAGVPRAGLPAAPRVRGAILASLLSALEHEGFDLADRRVCLTPLRKLWIGWREAHRRP